MSVRSSPAAFYASYGIDAASNVDLLNELKAPAGLLFVTALVMLIGVFVSSFTERSLGVAALVFSSYGFSRVLSISIDGMPNNALVSAALLEIALGVICFWGYRRARSNGREAGSASIRGEMA